MDHWQFVLKRGLKYYMSKEKAIRVREKWLSNKRKYCIVDTETTGLGKDDRVIEIAIIDLNGNILLNTLVNSKKRIAKEAERVHGISNSMVKDAPDIVEVANKVREILKDRIMIAYNAKFDARMVKQTFNLNLKYECLMYNVMDYFASSKFVSLEVATAKLRNNNQEHRALGDCYLCLQLINSTIELGEETG